MTDEVTVPEPGRASSKVIAGVMLLVLAVFVVVLATRAPSSERGVDSPLLGKLAPSTISTDSQGNAFDIDDYRGRWVVVNFFATWCGPCIREHPELVTFAERHAVEGDAAVVSIAFDDQPEDVAEFFRKAGGDWPVLVEDTGSIALDWSVAQVPETYIVAPSGQVVVKLIGGVTADGMDEIIDRYTAPEDGQ